MVAAMFAAQAKRSTTEPAYLDEGTLKKMVEAKSIGEDQMKTLVALQKKAKESGKYPIYCWQPVESRLYFSVLTDADSDGHPSKLGRSILSFHCTANSENYGHGFHCGCGQR